MIFLIAGASHTGKTLLAQRLLETLHYPYLSIDHLKMGLIRSGQTTLTPESNDAALTEYLWPIVREIIKTAIENRQNLIVEGCYIPFDWKKDFSEDYRPWIRYSCLVMSQNYISKHFDAIQSHACDMEHRLQAEAFTLQDALDENAKMQELAQQYGVHTILIDRAYNIEDLVQQVNQQGRNLIDCV